MLCFESFSDELERTEATLPRDNLDDSPLIFEIQLMKDCWCPHLKNYHDYQKN
jgi:hypothetical protein